jgi:hypothetical protein
VAPGIGPGFIDLDLDLVSFPFRKRRRRLLLTRVKGTGQTLRGQECRRPAARFSQEISSFHLDLLRIKDDTPETTISKSGGAENEDLRSKGGILGSVFKFYQKARAMRTNRL